MESISRAVSAGKRAGCVSPIGYRTIRVKGVSVAAHRLAFAYMTGRWPADEVDHRNGIPGDDRWENLREATRSQNRANSAIDGKNVSGLKGVGWSRAKQKWVARIQVNKTKHFLGLFATPQEAHAAYAAAAEQYFGEFARAA